MSEIKVGDRVKVEFEGVVEQTAYQDVAYVRDRDRGAWLSADRLTVIPQPIVLPTKRNALVEIDGDVYVFGEEDWHDLYGMVYEVDDLHREIKGSINYRVIFAGEDDE